MAYAEGFTPSTSLKVKKLLAILAESMNTFEVGGSKKTKKQIEGLENAYIVADDILIGFGNKIPIWLFGFLY